MADKNRKTRLKADTMTRMTIMETAVMMLLPPLLLRLSGVVSSSIISLPYSAFVMMYLLSELMWERSAFRGAKLLIKNERTREAGRLKNHTAAFGAAAGLVTALITVILQNFIFGDLKQLSGGWLIVLLIAPAFVFQGASGAIRGYLRALGAWAEVLLSFFLRSFVILIIPCVTGKLAANYGVRVDALMRTEIYSPIYGAAGFFAGVSIAMFISWLALVIMAFRYRAGEVISVGGPSSGGYAFLTMEGLLPLACFLLTVFDQWMFLRRHTEEGAEPAFMMTEWGKYFGGAEALTLLTSCICAILFILPVYQIHASNQRGDRHASKDRYGAMVRRMMALVLPVTVFIAGLSTEIMSLIIGKPDEAAAGYLRLEVFNAPLLCLGLILAIMFLKFGSLRAVMPGAVAGTVVHIPFVILVSVKGWGASLFTVSRIAGIAVLVGMTAFLFAASFKYKQEWLHGVIVPLGCSAVTGAVLWLLAPVFNGLMGEVLTIALLAAMGYIMYMILISALHGITADELQRIPGGGLFTGISRMFGRGY